MPSTAYMSPRSLSKLAKWVHFKSSAINFEFADV